MATLSLYEGLIAFKDIYDSAISEKSKRDVNPIKQDWVTVDNEMTCFYHASATGDTSAAQSHLDAIVSVLNGYDITINTPVPVPISLSFYTTPNSVLVPTDNDGSNPVYTNAVSTMVVVLGTVDDTSNWTFSLTTQTNVTAVIQNDNEVKVNDLTADIGEVVVTGVRTGYADLVFNIPIYKQKAGATGPGGGGTIQDASLFVRANNEGVVAGNARGVRAVDLQMTRFNPDEVASGNQSFIIAGSNNKADGINSGIAGGASNDTLNNAQCFIGGGSGNITNKGWSAIVGGFSLRTGSAYELVCGLFNTQSSSDALFTVGDGVSDVSRSNAFQIKSDGGVMAPKLKSGANQGAAGAIAGELWINTADNSIKIGV